MNVFGAEPENRKPRTKREYQRRITVLALRVYAMIGMSGEETDYREELKIRCARERLPYDGVQIESALHRARGIRGR